LILWEPRGAAFLSPPKTGVGKAPFRPVSRTSITPQFLASTFRVLECRRICDPDRLAIRERDERVERLCIERAQGFVRNVAEMRADGNVVHRTEWMVGGGNSAILITFPTTPIR